MFKNTIIFWQIKGLINLLNHDELHWIFIILIFHKSMLKRKAIEFWHLNETTIDCILIDQCVLLLLVFWWPSSGCSCLLFYVQCDECPDLSQVDKSRFGCFYNYYFDLFCSIHPDFQGQQFKRHFVTSEDSSSCQLARCLTRAWLHAFQQPCAHLPCYLDFLYYILGTLDWLFGSSWDNYWAESKVIPYMFDPSDYYSFSSAHSR